MRASASPLEAAVRSLEEVARSGKPPSHYLARDVLLSLGSQMREAGLASVEPWLVRVRQAGHRACEAWTDAVTTELSMACAEFAQSVDPRYLRMPGYDREYTHAARRRLADRLDAAEALGITLSGREVDLLAMADRVWSSFLTDSAFQGGVSGPFGNVKEGGVGRTPGSDNE